MDLADRPVGGEQPRVDEMDEGKDIAPVIGHADHARMGKPRRDLGNKRVRPRPLFRTGDEEIMRQRRGDDALRYFIPDLGVMQVDDHGIGRGGRGLRRRAQDRHLQRGPVGRCPGGLPRGAVFGPAMADVVQQRRGEPRQIGIEAAVGCRIEARVGPQVRGLPEKDVVAFRPEPEERRYAGVRAAIEGAVEETGAADPPRGVERARIGQQKAYGPPGRGPEEARHAAPFHLE